MINFYFTFSEITLKFQLRFGFFESFLVNVREHFLTRFVTQIMLNLSYFNILCENFGKIRKIIHIFVSLSQHETVKNS